MRIAVTNDDGVYSPGLLLLYEAVSSLGETVVIAPLEPRSAKGASLSLEEPIRLYELEVEGVHVYGISGSPSDAVHVARELLGKVDVLVSGVNSGDNTSIQNILVSGTVGAAAEAALLGIPAVAFSADVEGPRQFLEDDYRRLVVRAARAVTRLVAEEGLPEGVDLLCVNFPREFRGIVKLAPPARLRWREKLEKRVDPRGRVYYWLYGEPMDPEPGTDVYVVHVEGGIAITPISLDFRARGINSVKLERLATEVSRAVAKC